VSHAATVRAPPSRAIRNLALSSAENYGALSRPFVFVTGKGGTGKTTVARALAAIVTDASVRATEDVDAESALAEWLGCHLGRPAAAFMWVSPCPNRWRSPSSWSEPRTTARP
jgi:energy-coupling factor transporter ATP-binding protein EcfA2